VGLEGLIVLAPVGFMALMVTYLSWQNLLWRARRDERDGRPNPGRYPRPIHPLYRLAYRMAELRRDRREWRAYKKGER